jgi:NAD(P)-dependent dehydrogenase (short-subunit alcohol dehydrogenase family)
MKPVALPMAPSMRLDGRRALITGAGRGIGRAAAAALAQVGAQTYLVARTGHEVETVAHEIIDADGTAQAYVLDVEDAAAVAEFVKRHGPFDVLVNNAGTNRPAAFTNVTEKDFDAITSLNLRSAFFVAQAVAKSLIAAKRPGSLIMISSQMGLVGGEKRSVYCATKHGIEGMTKAIAVDLGPHGIRANTICPTFIDTPLAEPLLAKPDFQEWALPRIKLGRFGKVEDIMGAVIYLAGDASALVTGSALVVDGGWTAD